MDERTEVTAIEIVKEPQEIRDEVKEEVIEEAKVPEQSGEQNVVDIRTFRKSRNLSQVALAEALRAHNIQVNNQVISSLESGRIDIPENIVSAIRALYGVEVTKPGEREIKPRKKKVRVAKGPVPMPESRDTEPKTKAIRKTKHPARGLVIQSPLGGEITPEEIYEKIRKQVTGVNVPDSIYVRVDENAAYWVKGNRNGSVKLWE